MTYDSEVLSCDMSKLSFDFQHLQPFANIHLDYFDLLLPLIQTDLFFSLICFLGLHVLTELLDHVTLSYH